MHPPLFMGHGPGGPGVSFYTSREDHEPKLVMHGQIKPGAEPWCITLDRADVERLRDFCSAWLQGAHADLQASIDLLGWTGKGKP